MTARPKILTALTVPAGGWVFHFDITDPVGAQYDTPLIATVPAGDYFISWDAQADDLLHTLHTQIRSAINGSGLGSGRAAYIHLDESHKVNIQFFGAGFRDAGGDNDVRLDLPSSSADLVAALGFTTASNRTSTATDEPKFTADEPHAYGWYAGEDGQLARRPPVDINESDNVSARTIAGEVYTLQRAVRYRSSIDLQFLTAQETWSAGVEYAGVPVHPYDYNVPLECWFHAAKTGTRFRVYSDERFIDFNATTSAVAPSGLNIGANTTSSSTTVKLDGQTVREDQFNGMLVWVAQDAGGGVVVPERFYINDTATDCTLTSVQSNNSGFNWSAGSDAVITDGRYGTYVLDTRLMGAFDPGELPQIDRYNISIPMLRYEA